MAYQSLPTVNPGEIIASSWGNLVDNNLDWHEAQKVAKTGDTMSGVLVVGAGNPGTSGSIGCALNPAGGITARRERADSAWCQVLYRGNAQAGAAGDGYVRFMNGPWGSDTQTGNITLATSTTVNYGTSSDRRLKIEVGPIVDALERLGALRPIRHTWIPDPEAGEFDGFIADEVAEVVPVAVTGDADAVDDNGRILPQQLDPGKLVPLLVAAVQQLAARVADLERG